MTKEYKKDNFVIVWKPDKCAHAGICVKSLPLVYHVGEHPWVRPEFAEIDQLILQINQCPSGALSYYQN
jgi:uncharacterized Fe-S cluster protein YjdI